MSKQYDELQEQFNFVVDRLHPKNFNEAYKKDNRLKLLHEYGPYIYKWVVVKGHNQRENLNKLCELMKNPKVAKALRSLIKQYNKDKDFFDDQDKIGIEFVVVINEVLTRMKADDEAYPIYYDLALDLLRSRIDKMVAKADIDEQLAINLLLIVPRPDIVLRDNIVGIYTNRIVRRMYSYTYNKEEYKGLPEDTKSLKKIFTMLFGKDRLPEVVTSIALEKRPVQNNNNQNEVYNKLYALLTNFVVDYYEGLKPKVLKDQLLNFVDRRHKDRENKRDGSRRLQVNTLAKGDYPNIHKVVKKIKKRDDWADLL